MQGGQYLFKVSRKRWRNLFKYVPEAVENTHKIAERCNVEIEFGVTKLPSSLHVPARLWNEFMDVS